jgi:hypothetical protein
MSDDISVAVRLLVTERAARRCEYCLLHEDDSFAPHQVDHITSRRHCSERRPERDLRATNRSRAWKGSDIASLGADPHRIVPLFRPRTDRWSDHFRLESGTIVPLTEQGTATVRLLKLNDHGRVTERQVLIRCGRYPRGGR